MSYVSTDSSIKKPYFSQAWRSSRGTICGAVYLSTENSSMLSFDSAADARAVAAVCVVAAEAMERLEAESGTALPAEGEGGDGPH